jgi:MGT family glycosyltransferase
LPEIIPFPPDFDFPSPRLPDQHYIGASICLDRREQEFPWERLDPGKPLAYCALGTYLWYPAKRYHRFFNAVLEAARLMPDWQWVLATGGSLSPNDVGSVPTNVSIVRNAPQIGLLKRAQIMVTHGGANTVKECVLLGVPMVIFPLGGDHPGIAARAIYHGLAVQGEFTRINGMKLKSLVYAAINNAYLRTQVNLMQSRFVDMEEAKAGVKLVESLLPSYGRP